MLLFTSILIIVCTKLLSFGVYDYHLLVICYYHSQYYFIFIRSVQVNRPGFHVLQILLITVRVSTQFYFVASFEWVAFEQEHALSKHRCSVYSTTLFKMGGRDQKVPLPVFFPWNVGTSPQNFVTFGFNRLPHWCKTSRLYLVLIPNYWTWTKPTP